MDKTKPLSQSELYKSTHASFEDIVKVCVNSSSSINLIGKSKTEQIVRAIDTILRQLVA